MGRCSEERRHLSLASLARLFGSKALWPLETMESDWTAQPYSGRCYGALFGFGPGVCRGYGKALREPVGHLHWADAETTRIWMNYTDGAIESGERAAAAVLTVTRGRAR